MYAYFLALPQEELPYIKIPLHTLIKITPMAYGCHEERYPLPIAAVDTHRPKPARGAKDSAAVPDADADAPRAAPARDYFGDLSKVVASPDAQPSQEAANPLEAVKNALQKDAEADQLTPKAVKGS